MDQADRPDGRRTGGPRWWAGVAVVGLVAVGAFVLAAKPWIGGESRCAALGAQVTGSDGFRWDNGVTESGPEWISALTDGVSQPLDADRARLAVATAADDDGYARFRGALDDEAAEAAADRLRALAMDPEAASARGDGPEAADDIGTLLRATADGCSFA